MAGLDPTDLRQAPQDQSAVLANPYPQGYMTPSQAKAMYDYSQALLKNSMGAVPGTKGGWTVGVQHLVDALMGGQQAYAANKGELASRRYDAAQQPQAPGTLATPALPAGMPYQPENIDNAPSDKESALPEGANNFASTEGSDLLDKAANVTSKMESGGRYDNVTTTKNKNGSPQSALGRYGVMDFNVGPWTKEVLGKEMTPQEFLGNKDAQDAIYKAKMGSYIDKYGPEGAGRAWLGGENGVNHPNRADPFGTKVGDYGSRFAKALAFNGQPSAPAGNAGDAIALALAKGATAKGLPGAPAGDQGQPIVAPFAVPQRPQVPREQYERLMGSPWQSEAQKNTIRDEYMQQRQPIGVPYLGGTAIVNPSNPNQQFFSPTVHWGTEKGVVGERPLPQIVTPQGGGTVKDLEEPGAPGTSGGQAPGQPPALLKPPEPITTTPPVSTPAITPPASAPVLPPRAEVPGSPTNALAFNAEGGSPVVAAAGAAGAPTAGPAETPADALAKAQGAVAPPNIIPTAAPPPEAISPMGAKVAAALSAAPPAPAGEQTAENSQQFQQRMMDQGVQYEQRKTLAAEDAKNYTKNLQSYADIGIRSNKALPTLQIANNLVQDPRYYSGLLADPYEILQKAKSVFTGDKAAAAPLEVFNKILSGNIVTELKTLLGGLGQIRLAEINLITNSVANKYNTAPANAAVLKMMMREHTQATNIGQIAEQYDKGWSLDDKDQWVRRPGTPTNSGLQETINKYTIRHPLFSDSEIANIQHVLDISDKTANPKVPAAQTKKDLMHAAKMDLGGEEAPAATPTNAQTGASETPAQPQAGNIIRYDATGKRIQ